MVGTPEAIAAAASAAAVFFALVDVRIFYGWVVTIRKGKQIWQAVPAETRAAHAKRYFLGEACVRQRNAVTLHDMDFIHFTNSKYYKVADWGRGQLLTECGVLQAAMQKGRHFAVAATSMRFRRELRYGARYTLESRIVGYDDVAFYIEQRFLSVPSPADTKDGAQDAVPTLHAVMHTRLQVTQKTTTAELLAAVGVTDLPPRRPPPPDIQAWTQSVFDGSARLRRECSATSKL